MDNKIEFDYVIATLNGRIVRKELETDFESLALSISNQTDVKLEQCKEILLTKDASIIADILRS